MMKAGTVMHTATTAASLPPLNTGSLFTSGAASAEVAWGPWGPGEAGVDVTLAPPVASAETAEDVDPLEAESEVVTRKESSDVNWPPGFCLMT